MDTLSQVSHKYTNPMRVEWRPIRERFSITLRPGLTYCHTALKSVKAVTDDENIFYGLGVR